MNLRIFSLLTTLLSLAASATPAGENLRTTAWGYVWERPYFVENPAEGAPATDVWMSATIATNNTPGNVNFSGYRLTAPVYLAFLDGYDTRRIGTTTDDPADYRALAEQVTNAYFTARFVNYADLLDRYQRLERLECGATNTLWLWTSSYIDEAMSVLATNLPPAAPFDWTQDLRSKIYGPSNSAWTRWLPCFAAMETNDAVRPVYRKSGYRIPRGIFWNDILPAISLGDADVKLILEHEGTASDPSVCTFDRALQFAYDYADVTNIVSFTNASARHVVRQLGQESQALSLFDRTVYVHGDVTAYTNRADGYASVSFTAQATVGPVAISVDSFGNPEWQNLSHSGATISLTGGAEREFRFDVTNNPGTYAAPRSRVTQPTLECGAGFTLADATRSAAFQTDGLDPRFNELAGEILSQVPFGSCFVKFSAVPVSGYEIFGFDVTAEAIDDDMVTPLGISATAYLPVEAFPMSADYEVSHGSVSVSSSYAYQKTTPVRLPFGVDDPVTAQQFRASSKYVGFGSFVASSNFYDFASTIRADAEATHLIDWGYRANTRSSNVYLGHYTMLGLLEAQTTMAAVDNPETYTGLHASALDTAILNFNTNSYNLGSATMKAAYVGGTGESAIAWDGLAYIADDGEGGYAVNIGEEPVDTIPIGSYTLCISVTVPSYGIQVRKGAKSVNTYVKFAVEDNWKFPQLTTTPQNQ